MAVSENEFIETLARLGPTQAAKALGITERRVYQRRADIEKRLGEVITFPKGVRELFLATVFPQRAYLEIVNGVVLIASDAHYWPDRITTAHKAFVGACKELQPKIVIMNGDALDGARISRHAPIGWENRPALIDELEATKARLDEIKNAAKNADLIWTLGNHDSRFETRLASVAPEYAKIHGFHLKDHIPEWRACWSAWINEGELVVKHRYKGGTHAGHNNALGSGKSMATGHDHQLKVTPYTDYNGTRYGIQTGTLADIYGEQFTDYTEDSPRNWNSGFIVCTFREGRLLPPETVTVIEDGIVAFRGRVYHVA